MDVKTARSLYQNSEIWYYSWENEHALGSVSNMGNVQGEQIFRQFKAEVRGNTGGISRISIVEMAGKMPFLRFVAF